MKRELFKAVEGAGIAYKSQASSWISRFALLDFAVYFGVEQIEHPQRPKQISVQTPSTI